MVFPVQNSNSKVEIRLDKFQFGKDSFETIWLKSDVMNWKRKILKLVMSADFKLVRFDANSRIYEDFDVTINSSDPNGLGFYRNGTTNSIEFPATNFMWIKAFMKEPPAIGLYVAFKADLTTIGAIQLSIFEKQLLETSKIFNESKSIYAPFTSVVQSSGSGKSKLCAQTLLTHPGVYLVFRSKDSTGIPKPAAWINSLVDFVFKAEADELPLALENWKKCEAINYTPSRFLIALHSIILTYFKKYEELYSASSITREDCIEKIGKHFLEDPITTNSYFNPTFPSDDKRTVNDVIRDILNLVNGIPAEININSYGLNLNLIKSLMPTKSESESNVSSVFPFLIFLDEADFLNELTARGRVPGIHVVRRALHLLGSRVQLLVVAIGTNSDVLDFTLSVKDNSLRYFDRKNLLPPLTLSCNWDIFCKEYLRSSSYVNTHHILSRSLVKSYMALVNYVSTDGRELKVSYSSEPILAMAARNLLSSNESRESAFNAMKKFIEMQAIDKGRIVENIFEHFALFVIDDAEPLDLRKPVEDNTLPASFKTLVDCDTYLLETQDRSGVPIIPILDFSSLYSNYRLIPVGNYLVKMMGQEDFEVARKFIPERKLNSLMNCTHFVNLERLKGSFK